MIPHDTYPGYKTPQDITDLWWNPLLNDKWAGIVKHVEFLRQPSRCVFTGSIGPIYQVKALTIFTLSTDGEKLPMTVTQWRPTLLNHDTGPAIIVDCIRQDEVRTQKALAASNLAGLIEWDGPRRSLGNKAVAPRCAFVGYFQRTQVTDLDIHLNISILRKSRTLQTALIGSRSLFVNGAALLIDVGEPQALSKASELMDEVVLVSPRLALATTSKPVQEWATHMTEQFQQDPLAAISKVRQRVSKGGRPFAKPYLLDPQMQASRNQLLILRRFQLTHSA